MRFVEMPVLVLSADVGFINFDFAKQLREVLINHRGANAMTHIPGCAIVAAADLAMDLKRAHALLALSHQVNNLEPSAQRIVSVLENSARDNREAIAILAAAI